MGDKRAAEKSLYKDPKRGLVGRSLRDSRVTGDETRKGGRQDEEGPGPHDPANQSSISRRQREALEGFYEGSNDYLVFWKDHSECTMARGLEGRENILEAAEGA